MEKQRALRGNIALLIAAFIWGSTFVAQSVGADKVGPFTFLCIRSFMGAAVLLPLVLITKGRAQQTPNTSRKTVWLGGLLCGVALCIASLLQQEGIAHTSVGNAGFITAMYILIVPILGLFMGKKVPLKMWLCVAVAVVALYLMSIKEGFSVGLGDGLLMLCAVCFSVHILVVDRVSPQVNGIQLSCIQFLCCGLLTVIPMLVLERPSLEILLDAWMPIAYAGVLSSGVAYTLQIVGQKYTKPTIASLLMSLESVFALLSGMLVLGEIPTLREGIGCVLMFGAIVVAQLPGREHRA